MYAERVSLSKGIQSLCPVRELEGQPSAYCGKARAGEGNLYAILNTILTITPYREYCIQEQPVKGRVGEGLDRKAFLRYSIYMSYEGPEVRFERRTSYRNIPAPTPEVVVLRVYINNVLLGSVYCTLSRGLEWSGGTGVRSDLSAAGIERFAAGVAESIRQSVQETP